MVALQEFFVFKVVKSVNPITTFATCGRKDFAYVLLTVTKRTFALAAIERRLLIALALTAN